MFRNRSSLGWAAVLLLLPFGSSMAEGQEVTGSFEQLRSRVSAGDKVTVTDVTGREMQGTIADLSSSSLALVVGTSQTTFLEADVETISRRDSRWNGTLWGLGLGGALGVTLDRSFVGEYGRDDISSGSSVAVVATAAGIGAGVGFAVDALIKGRQVIYSRRRTSIGKNVSVLPVWGTGRKGILVSLRLRR